MMWLEPDRSSEQPLIRQIYEQIRLKILRGELCSGEKLLSTRELASILHVSRNVVMEAYELLTAEGFVNGVSGSGTYVAPGAALEPMKPAAFFLNKDERKNSIIDLIDFRSGVPALDLFPRKKWSHLYQQVCLDSSPSLLGYDEPAGCFELRETLCRYLKRTRGIDSNPHQIIVTSGAMQALFLTTQALLNASDEIIVEDPMHREIQEIFKIKGSRFHPIPVDEHGIQTQLLPERQKISLINVTPSHQYPKGGNLPIQRRIDLIQYARKQRALIIEDDYDSEFRYEGPPVSSLQSLDPDRVIYIGSFSKTLFPALRLGYLVLPEGLIQKYRKLKRSTDNHTHSLNQMVLARFIEEGDFDRHIARMKKLYRQRRDTLIEALKGHFSDSVTISGTSTGLHLTAEFNREFQREWIQHMKAVHRVAIYPMEEHAIIKGNHTRQLIFGYSHLHPEKILQGIEELHKAQ